MPYSAYGAGEAGQCAQIAPQDRRTLPTAPSGAGLAALRNSSLSPRRPRRAPIGSPASSRPRTRGDQRPKSQYLTESATRPPRNAPLSKQTLNARYLLQEVPGSMIFRRGSGCQNFDQDVIGIADSLILKCLINGSRTLDRNPAGTRLRPQGRIIHIIGELRSLLDAVKTYEYEKRKLRQS